MITRSTNRTSWTELSGRSLAQVENVADIVLPIYYDDIESSSQWFGSVETIEEEPETDIIDYENWRQPQPRFLNFVSEDQYNQTRGRYPIPQKRISISLLGWTATGKSELLGRTKFAFSAPLEIFVTSILSNNVELRVHDVMGMEEHVRLHRAVISAGDAIILVYRIDLKHSWEVLKEYAGYILQTKPDRRKHPVVVFQNKFRDDADPNELLSFRDEGLPMIGQTEIHRAWAMMKQFQFVVGDSRDSAFVAEMLESLAKRRMAWLSSAKRKLNYGRKWTWTQGILRK